MNWRKDSTRTRNEAFRFLVLSYLFIIISNYALEHCTRFNGFDFLLYFINI